MHVTFLTLGIQGRLGNQLFQIAVTLGTARRNQCDWVLPPWEYQGFFEHPLPMSEKISIENTYNEPTFAYRPIDVHVSTNLCGYFQSPHYFEHYADELRYYLAPNQTLINMVSQKKEIFFSGMTMEKTCSLNVRRGDYIGHPGFVDLSETDYYMEAMKRFDFDTQWIVFSDNIDWCHEFFGRSIFSQYQLTFIPPTHDLTDLFLIASCNNHIIANSTFGWWGAWLSNSPNKRVISPKSWAAGPFLEIIKSNPCPDDYHDTSYMTPSEWELIDNRVIGDVFDQK